MPLELPTAVSVAQTGSPRILILYGPPKVGKTTLAATILNTFSPPGLLLDIEDGSDFVSAIKLKLENPLQLKPFVSLCQSKNKPYPIIAIDTLDHLEQWAEQEATRRFKQTIMGKNFTENSVLDLPKGGGHYYLRNCFNEFFNDLASCAQYVIFLAHIKDKFINIDGKEVSAADLDLIGKIRNISCANADAIGRVFRDKDGKLFVSFSTTEVSQCGTRCPHLRGKTFQFSNEPTREEVKQIYNCL
jgi:DNA polymerase III delta prime subunit